MVRHGLNSPFSSVLNNMQCILFCATFGNPLRPPRLTSCAAPLVTSLLLLTIVIYLKHRHTDNYCSPAFQVFSRRRYRYPPVCASGEKQASLPELANIDRPVILTVWTYWITEKLSSALIYICYISNNTTVHCLVVHKLRRLYNPMHSNEKYAVSKESQWVALLCNVWLHQEKRH